MEKKVNVEAVHFDMINHTSLNTLHLFYDFIYIDGETYFVRKNNLLAIFIPFVAKKIWYEPFQVSGEKFERLNDKHVRLYSLGIVVGLATVFGTSSVFGSPLNDSFPFDSVTVNLQKFSSPLLRYAGTLLILVATFILLLTIINCLWRALGYIIFKFQGFNKIDSNKKLSYKK